MFSFSRKALVFCLANKSNLFRWKKSDTNACTFCQKPETQLHVLSNCSIAANQNRYTWRHNSVLRTLSNYVMQLQQYGYKIFIDLDGYSSPSSLFKSCRPDVVLLKDDEITVIELTVCFETNIEKSKQYKLEKYKHLENDLQKPIRSFTLITVEITTLGFYKKHKSLVKLLKDYNINVSRCYKKMGECALRASYFIYTQRNKEWTNPLELLFY